MFAGVPVGLLLGSLHIIALPLRISVYISLWCVYTYFTLHITSYVGSHKCGVHHGSDLGPLNIKTRIRQLNGNFVIPRRMNTLQ